MHFHSNLTEIYFQWPKWEKAINRYRNEFWPSLPTHICVISMQFCPLWKHGLSFSITPGPSDGCFIIQMLSYQYITWITINQLEPVVIPFWSRAYTHEDYCCYEICYWSVNVFIDNHWFDFLQYSFNSSKKVLIFLRLLWWPPSGIADIYPHRYPGLPAVMISIFAQHVSFKTE